MLPFSNPRRLKTVAVGVSALCIAGVVFEQIGRYQDRRRYHQIGRSVDIGGRTLNIYCSGESGPTVVFETFGHMSGYSWSAVQREAAKFTRACWYDRAAYGWSDPAPMPRTFQSVALDLHALLHAAAIPPPYVLVGGGDAASHIRVYHGMYPGEVAGIGERPMGKTLRIFRSSRARGGLRHLPDLGPDRSDPDGERIPKPRSTPTFGLTSEQQAELDFLSDNPTAPRGSELCAREESMQQVRAAGNLDDVPLVVLASAAQPPAATSAQSSVASAWNRHQVEQVQPGLARLSSCGRFVFLDNDVTAGAIIRAVLDVAGASTSPEK
jgi:hypothetical protein